MPGSTWARRGLAARPWGCARLAAQCAGPLRRDSRCTGAMGLTSPRLGAFQCGRLHLVVAFILPPRKGVPRQGHGNADGVVDRGSSCTPRFAAMVRRVGWSRVHGVVCAVLYSFLGVPGLQVVRAAYWPGALDAWWVPSGPLSRHHGGFARATISPVCKVAEKPRCGRTVVGSCENGLNGAPPVPYSGGLAGSRSCPSVPAVAWWPVEYGSGLGDPRILGVWAAACRLLGHRESQGVGLPGCLVRAVREGARMSLRRAVCAARASSSVPMGGDTCPAANARLWWIARTGQKLSEVGRPAARSWGGLCCRPSRRNLHAADQSLLCDWLRWAHRDKQ